MLLAFLDQGHRPLTLTFDLSCFHQSRNIPLFIYNFPTKVQHHWISLLQFKLVCHSSWARDSKINFVYWHSQSTVEPLYNEVLGTMKITLLYQVSHYIRVKKQRNIKSWDQQNYLVIRGFCYIRPRYNEVPLYHSKIVSHADVHVHNYNTWQIWMTKYWICLEEKNNFDSIAFL